MKMEENTISQGKTDRTCSFFAETKVCHTKYNNFPAASDVSLGIMEKMEKRDIRLFTKEELAVVMQSLNQPKYRTGQVYQWLWQKGAEDFEEMSNLPLELRSSLSEYLSIKPIKEDLRQQSTDGTIKIRWKLHDGHLIESVLIPVPDDRRFTVCVSSQVGCSLACKFCATGKMKRERNLDAAEIVDQVRKTQEICLEKYGHPLTNIVYMGMGEPLLAYNSVMRSINLLTSPEGMGYSPRRLTVSTAGIAKMIRRMADDGTKVNLALSLHAADDTKRDSIMPINEQNNLEALMEALKYYFQVTKNRLSYEYIAFHNFNLFPEDAEKLTAMCKDFPVRVNIIEYNPVEGVNFTRAQEEQVDNFALKLRQKGVMVTVRRSRGKDIDAACGQLANKE